MRKFENDQLQKRYQHQHQFKERVDRSEAQYRTYLKKAGEKKNLQISQSILEQFMNESNTAIYFFYGHLQPAPVTQSSDLTLFFLKNFRPPPQRRFILVYFNHGTGSSEYYFEFKNILALLPLTLIQHLQEFILVKPYFYIKAFDYVGLGTINRIFSQRYTTLDNCAELCERLKITVHDFVSFVPEQISAEFPKNLKRRPSLVNYRINVKGQNMTEEQLKEKTQFQLCLKGLLTKEVYKLQNYELGDIGIPIIIQLLIHYFRTKPAGLSMEGIFRKSVSIDQENQTLQELSKRNYDYLQKIENPFLIACLIKRFFTNLKEPIIPYPAYEALLHDQGISNKKQHVKKYIQGLPKLNFMTLAFLIEFLKKDVVKHEQESKMSLNNLAICFTPSLMRSEKASMADLLNASKGVLITNIMLDCFEDIFGDQQQRAIMYKKSAISRNRDFTKAIKKELDIEEGQKRESQSYAISSFIRFKETENNKPQVSNPIPIPATFPQPQLKPHVQSQPQTLPQLITIQSTSSEPDKSSRIHAQGLVANNLPLINPATYKSNNYFGVSCENGEILKQAPLQQRAEEKGKKQEQNKKKVRSHINFGQNGNTGEQH